MASVTLIAIFCGLWQWTPWTTSPDLCSKREDAKALSCTQQSRGLPAPWTQPVGSHSGLGACALDLCTHQISMLWSYSASLFLEVREPSDSSQTLKHSCEQVYGCSVAAAFAFFPRVFPDLNLLSFLPFLCDHDDEKSKKLFLYSHLSTLWTLELLS